MAPYWVICIILYPPYSSIKKEVSANCIVFTLVCLLFLLANDPMGLDTFCYCKASGPAFSFFQSVRLRYCLCFVTSASLFTLTFCLKTK